MENENENWDFDYEGQFKYEQKQALKAFFVKDNIDCNLKDCNFFVKWFYWFKALVCLKLHRFNKKEYGLMVITYNEYSYPDGCGWNYVSVGEGLLKGWNIEMGTDGV